MQPLIARPATKGNESLLGYLLRLTEENVFESPLNLVWYTALFDKNNKASINDFTKYIASGQFNLNDLATITGEPRTDLEIKSYRLLEKGVDGYPDFHLFLNAQVPANFIRFDYPRYCPECMKSDPYHRFYWDYVPLTGCPIHKKLLMDICPKCHQQITWSRATISKCGNCDYNLFEFEGIDIPDGQMDHITLIANIFRRCDNKKHLLYSFALFKALRAISDFASSFLPSPKILLIEPQPYQQKSILSLPHIKSLGVPVPVIKTQDFMDVLIPEPQYPHLKSIQTIQKLNEYLVMQLFTQKRTSRVKMRHEFQWQPNAEVHQKMVKFFTGKDVPLLVNYTAYGQLTPIQRARHYGIKNSAYSLSSRRPYSTESGKSSFEQRNDIVNQITAAQHLGISEYLLNKLVKEKVFIPLSGPNIDGFGDHLYSIKHLQKFMDSLLSLVDEKSIDEETISLDGYIKTFDVSRRTPYVSIVKAMLERKVKVVKVPNARLADVLLSLESVRAFCPQISLIQGYISVKKISSIIGIYGDAIYRTLDTGLLPYRADGRKKLIRIEDFDKFNEQYIFIKEIATKHKCNSTNLADKLIDEGITPVSGPKIDKNLVYIFNRADIQSLDIIKIINKRQYKSSTGRIAKDAYTKSYHKLIDELSLITSTEAAERLSISSQMLGKLLKINELSLYQDGALPAYKKYLKSADLTSYINRYRNNPQLISYAKAAEFMEETPDRFQHTWVRFKRIEIVDDGIGNKYVDRHTLSNLKQFKKVAISIQEASELKGIDRSYFSNQIKLKKIIPVSGPGIDEYGNYFLNRKEVEDHTHENWWK